MLLGRYFEGINIHVDLIVKYINSRDIIQIDTQTVLDGVCNDIDICINYNLLFRPYKESLHFFLKNDKTFKQHQVQIFSRPTES
jgi:hypothetical protein